MLFMGSGEHSGAECWKLVSELVELLIEMGGWQQPRMSTDPPLTPEEEQRERDARHRWNGRAIRLIDNVACALGYQITIEGREQP